MILKKNGFFLLIITILNDAAINLIVFFLTRYMAEHGAGLIRLGIAGGIFSISFAVSSIVFGGVSDKSGRKKTIIYGIALIFFGTIGCLIVEPTRSLFFVFFVFIGISPGLVYPALIAWLGQDTDRFSNRAVSGRLLLFCLSWNAGVVIGMITGGRLYLLRYDGPIIASLIFLGINCILILLCKEETGKGGQERYIAPPPDFSGQSGKAQKAPGDSDLYKRLGRLTALGFAVSMSTILYLFPQVAVEIELPADKHGIIIALMRVSVIGTYLIMHFYSFWKYNPAVLFITEGAGVIGLLLVFFTRNLFLISTGLFLIGILSGYGYFAGLYYGNNDPNSSCMGRDSGLHQGFLGIGVAAGSVMGGLIGKQFGSGYPFLLSAIILSLIIIIQGLTFILRKKPAGFPQAWSR